MGAFKVGWRHPFEMAFWTYPSAGDRDVPVRGAVKASTRLAETGVIVESAGACVLNRQRETSTSRCEVSDHPRRGHELHLVAAPAATDTHFVAPHLWRLDLLPLERREWHTRPHQVHDLPCAPPPRHDRLIERLPSLRPPRLSQRHAQRRLLFALASS